MSIQASKTLQSKNRFTREQRIAQSADRHQAVTAGAGAGKTSVLVERYLHLLFGKSIQVNVREIVAITFTRKAAAEMKHRIAAEIESRLADESQRPHWERIKFVRERFSGARISTIHSYCAQLLREFPIEAGVNPNFTELEEYDITILKEQAINEVLEAWLEPEESKKKKNSPQETAPQIAALTVAKQIQALPTEQDTEPVEQEFDSKETSKKNSEASTENSIPLIAKKRFDTKAAQNLAAQRVWTFFGKQNLFTILQQLLQSAERFSLLRAIYDNKSDTELFQELEKTFLQRLFTLSEEYLVSLEQAITYLDFNQLSKATRPRFEQLSSSLAILLKQAREGSQNLTAEVKSERLWQNAVEYANFLITTTQGEKICARNGSISGTYTRSEKAFLDKEAFMRVNHQAAVAYSTLGAMLGVMEHHDDDRVLFDIARTLMAIASDAWDVVREEKERVGGLDFDDLQLKADALLNNADVRQKIRLNTRFLMMDEFQDTDELQYRIARKIIGVLGENPESTPSMTNLFIVGDPKQSIYRFRGADVRVFAKAKRDIEKFNRTLLNHQALSTTFTTPFGTEEAAHSAEQAGIISLRATFRLLPEIAAFVNVVAGDQLRRGSTEFDVEYEDIICGVGSSELKGSVTMLLPRIRNEEDTEKSSEKNQEQKNQEQSSETFDKTTSEEIASETETDVSEARLLAEYISSIASEDAAEPFMVRGGKDGVLRPATFGDVMILVRSRTGSEALLTALRRANVPFMLSAGRGFYERQEILDIRSFLLFLQNTNDDIALAALLRSPFFALSDTELYAISRAEINTTTTTMGVEASSNALWQRLQSYCETESDDKNAHNASSDAIRAFSTLKNLLPLAAQLSIPTLIRTILEQTSWRGMVAADERFEQIEANLEKLLSIARKYENKGFRNLYDFAEELRRLALYAFSEGEADTETGKNAVRIMTIHGAKGLEAPIVALFNMNADASMGERGTTLSFDAQLGVSCTMFRSREDGTVEHYKTPLHLMASKQDEIAEEAELKRLLYVALTRAKDHLILSGKCYQRKDGTMGTPKGFLRMVVESLNAETLNLLNEPYIPLPKHSLTLLDGEIQHEMNVEFTMPIIRSLQQIPSKSPQNLAFEGSEASAQEQNNTSKMLPILVPELLLGTLETSVEGDVYSASQLQLFRRDPDEYERLYRLGLPPADVEGFITGRAGAIDDENDATIGTSAGECIHGVLEHLPMWFTGEGVFLASEYQRVVERVLPQKMSFVPADLLARIQRETQAVASTPLLKRLSSEINAAKFEFPITMPIQKDFLIGSIDALVTMPSGEVEVWDWKTNRVSSTRDMETLLKHYRLQLEIYAFVVAHLYPEQDIIRTRLLFTRRATANAEDEDWTRVLEFTRLDIQAIEENITRTIREIRVQSYGVEMA